MLNLYLRWERGELVFYNPDTGQRIATLEDERTRADSERTRADREHEARLTTEARVRELEQRLQQQGS